MYFISCFPWAWVDSTIHEINRVKGQTLVHDRSEELWCSRMEYLDSLQHELRDYFPVRILLEVQGVKAGHCFGVFVVAEAAALFS